MMFGPPNTAPTAPPTTAPGGPAITAPAPAPMPAPSSVPACAKGERSDNGSTIIPTLNARCMTDLVLFAIGSIRQRTASRQVPNPHVATWATIGDRSAANGTGYGGNEHKR